MMVKVSGKVYFHQFSSQEDGWEYVVAPDQYQSLPEEDVPREVAPTDPVLVHRVVEGRIVPDWGFWTLVPPWIEAPCALGTTPSGRERLLPPVRTHFNSRADTLVGSKGWRNLLARNRCVLFADSFFEWSDEPMLAGRPKQVGRFSLASGDPMAFAGICSPVRVADRDVLTVSVVTTSPNDLLRRLPHHRMPAILRGPDLARWMDPGSDRPELALHSTDDDAMAAQVVAAEEFPRLVGTPSARISRKAAKGMRKKGSDDLPDLFGDFP